MLSSFVYRFSNIYFLGHIKISSKVKDCSCTAVLDLSESQTVRKMQRPSSGRYGDIVCEIHGRVGTESRVNNGIVEELKRPRRCKRKQ